MLVRPQDVHSSGEPFEVVGVFNPGVIATADGVRLLLRVAERPREQRPGMVGLPRWREGSIEVDWVPEGNIQRLDPRVVRLRDSGDIRLTFASHLRVATSADGRSLDAITDAVFRPQLDWEEFGVEDPRITRLNGRCYFTYVAVSRHGAATALASTEDFVHFERHGIIFPPENKDVVLFPERIGGRYAALHRPAPATHFSPPEMWLAWSEDLVHWGGHEPLVLEPGDWETGRVGGGVPPIRTTRGWLAIYHGNRKPERPGEVGPYAAGALLLDLENPARVRGRAREPILAPQTTYEREGFVGGVVFPTGAVDCGETLLIYYGAADSSTAVVGVPWKNLTDAIH